MHGLICYKFLRQQYDAQIKPRFYNTYPQWFNDIVMMEL